MAGLDDLAAGVNPLSVLAQPQAGPLMRAQALQMASNPQSGFAPPGGLSVAPLGGRRPSPLDAITTPQTDTKPPPTPPSPNIDHMGALDSRAASAADHIGRIASPGLDFANAYGGGQLPTTDMVMGPASQDRNLALAQAGFAMMGSSSPYFGQALGQGLSYGLRALQERQAQRAEMALKLAEARRNQTAALAPFVPYMTNDQLNAAMGGSGIKGNAVGTTLGGAPAGAPPAGGGPSSSVVPADVVSAAVNDLRAYPIGSPRYTAALSTLEAAAKYDPALQHQLAVAGVGKINRSQGEELTGNMPGAPVTGTTPAPTVTTQPPPPAGSTPPVAKTPADLIPTAQPLPQPTTVGQRDQVGEYGKKLGALPDEIDQKADQAKQANYLLGQMRSESQTWDMGKGATTLQNAQSYIVGLNNLLPKNMQIDTKDMEKSVGDFQAFNKNSMELARQVVRATSSRAAFQEMQMIQQALPSAGMTKQGFTQIAAQLEGANDYALAMQQAKDKWIAKNGPNMNGFDAWFNKSVDPAVFMLNRLSPEDRAATVKKIEANPNGKASMAKLIQQTKTAQALGLLGGE